jgi:hypothetical protein
MSYQSIAEATGFLRSVKKQLFTSDFLAARIAAQFAREDRFVPIDRVAGDSVKAADLARAVQAGRPGKRRSSDLTKLKDLCARYGATIEQHDTSAGVSIELRFPEGRFATRAGTLFPLL